MAQGSLTPGSLTRAMLKEAGVAPAAQPVPAEDAPPKPVRRAPKKAAAAKVLAIRLSQDAHRQLKSYPAMEGRSVQDCVQEALDDFFDKNKKPQIARKAG